MDLSASFVCPCCQSLVFEDVLTLQCGNIDGSALYPELRLKTCVSCGHVFNVLSPEEISGLSRYYDNEYAPVNFTSPINTGDRPGSSDPLTTLRFSNLFSFIAPHVPRDAALIDVGCALGGFLQYLKNKGFNNLAGVDPTPAYVACAQAAGLVPIKQGVAENLPYPDNSYDVIVIEQVLEHLVQPSLAFREAFRVLKKNGLFCIGVPDASRYAEYSFFDFYWVLLREHIQHFSIQTLSLLAEAEGFTLIDYVQNHHAIMSDKMVMPNLCALFRKSTTSNEQNSSLYFSCKQRGSFKKYVVQELSRLTSKKVLFKKLADEKIPIYAWGIGREFLFLYEEAGLKHCNIAGLIDINPYRQQQTVGGLPIGGPEQLDQAGQGAIIIITAIAHVDVITMTLKKIGFQGEIYMLPKD